MKDHLSKHVTANRVALLGGFSIALVVGYVVLDGVQKIQTVDTSEVHTVCGLGCGGTSPTFLQVFALVLVLAFLVGLVLNARSAE